MVGRWRSRRGLTSAQVVELLTDYVEGALDARAAAAVRTHLARCPDCTTYLDQLRATERALAAMDDVEPPQLSPERRSALVEGFKDFRQRRSP